jgi:protein involved in polysaccharide export with SLBB domain
MIEHLRKAAGHWVLALGVVFVALLSGCQSGAKFSDTSIDIGNTLHVGDVVTVSATAFNGDKVIADQTQRIGEDGNISLLYIGQVKADGQTPSKLQKAIHDDYVPQYYTGLNVVVIGEVKYFYVDGEVRAPNKYEYHSDMTVVKAISVAGGFTDFAKGTKVQITHAGKVRRVNVPKAIEDPSLDVRVYPGDTVHVPRRILW